MPTKRLLLVSHSRAGATARLREAILEGVAEAQADLEVVDRDAPAAELADVLAADGVLFATPARFGALAGLTKDFLERIYPWFDERPNVRPGMPWTAVVKGASDPDRSGARPRAHPHRPALAPGAPTARLHRRSHRR